MNSIDLQKVEYTTGADGKLILSGWQHKQRQNKRAVLFVHGLAGQPELTWSASTGARFADLITADPELADYDVFTFGYHTTYLSGSRIESAALQLADEIHGNLQRYQLVLIAHSLGGLVCMRYVLDRLIRHRPLPILGLLLYGTPTTGTDLIKLAQMVGFALQFTAVAPIARILGFAIKSHRQLQQLASASDFLSTLHDQWALRCVNGGDTTLYPDERAWLPVRVVTAEKDYFVSEISAKSFYGEVDWHPLPFSHTALVKPESQNDVRYQRAKDFLKSCRRSKDAAVLSQLWKTSQDIWSYHRGRLIKDWRYVVDLYPRGGRAISPALETAGFSRAVVESSYTTVLEQPFIRIGISLGYIAAKQLWKKMRNDETGTSRPAYVHGLYVDALPKKEAHLISEALVSVLSGKDMNVSWSELFTALNVELADGDQTVQLRPAEIARESSALVRTFELPAGSTALLGEELRLKVAYESIIPKSLPLFTVSFPWLTQSCVCEISVHGTTEFFTWTSHVIGDPKLDVTLEEQGNLHKLMFQSDQLLLPGTRVELRWQLRPANNATST